jgi:hypothetical protein
MNGIYLLLVTIIVLSIPVLAQADDIRDIKGPVFFSADYGWLLLISIILLLGAVSFLARFLYRKKKSRSTDAGKPRVPHEVACEALNSLRAEDLPSRGLIKEYYIRLSNIVRHYLEDRFDIRAPEMTTEEFLFTLRDSQILTGSQKNLLKEFLNFCDIVKFAKYGPTKGEIEDSYNAAKRFVDETREREGAE